MLDLVFAISLHAFGQVDFVTFAEVEQRPRRNRQHQFVTQSLCHLRSSLSAIVQINKTQSLVQCLHTR